MTIKKTTDFIFELGQLKRLKTSGWSLAGITANNSPSIAEHTLRAAQIGYILATMENVNAEKVASILIMHDITEARTGDQNKVSARYYSKKEAEEKAIKEQLQGLNENLRQKWQEYFNEFEERTTPEGIVAKDADWLEMAFQAKEYLEQGYPTQNWIDNVNKALETKSSKQLIKAMVKNSSTNWWKNLKKMTYNKLAEAKKI